MNEANYKDEEVNEPERTEPISLMEPRYMSCSANDSVTFVLLKFRKHREGVIHCLKRIRIETDGMLKLRNKKEEIQTEIRELRVYIRKAKRKNKKLEMHIKREIEQLHLFHSNIAILRNNKYKLLKLQEFATNEINFMSAGIHRMMERKQEIVNQYYEVVIEKYKMKLENESLKKKITGLKSDERMYEKDYNNLKKTMKTIVQTVKQSNP